MGDLHLTLNEGSLGVAVQQGALLKATDSREFRTNGEDILMLCLASVANHGS